MFNNLHTPRIIPDRRSPKLAMESAKDSAMADQMSSYWVNFAKNGDPNGKDPGSCRSGSVQGSQRAAPVIGDIKEYPAPRC